MSEDSSGKMKKYKRGYTQGVFDMFHIGHLNLINHAKENCEYLIVGVNSDELVEAYKHKQPVIHEEDRAEIVRNIKAVDECVIAHTLDKIVMHGEVPFDAIFIGDDWRGNDRWKKTIEDLSEIGVDVVFLPYTAGVNSTTLRTVEKNRIQG